MKPNIDELRGQTQFELSEDKAERIIKVLGVGGGGGNAVSTMFREEKIQGVSYLLCNTDKQALLSSPVPDRIVLGPETTGGLGAGNKPSRAEEAAEESREEIRQALTSDGTKMVFITAGMGGGTGTGAAPIIGRIAREAGLLTVGIVTIPFKFEGTKKIFRALRGVNALKDHVDALLIVNNERLKEVYKGYTMSQAFKYADATLSNAARGISDMINRFGHINLDFRDVETTLENKGIAVISSGIGEGNLRLQKAIDQALNSPLLNNNNIRKATHLLLAIYSSSENELTAEEVEMLTKFTDSIESDFDTKWGYYIDDELSAGSVRVTLLASGFDYETTRRSIAGQEDAFTDEIHKEDDQLSKQAKDLYGEDVGGRSLRANKRPLLLSLEELDNDELLYIAEETPALNRDLKQVQAIRQRYQQSYTLSGDSQSSDKESYKTLQAEEVFEPKDNVIHFEF